jgi:hypothetical protein
LDEAFQTNDPSVSLRSDPAGIAPERALVFVSAVPISNFARVARDAGLEIIAEVDLDDDYLLPDGLPIDDIDSANPTLYATMPTESSLRTMRRLWRLYENGGDLPVGQTPWRNLFEILVEIRPWGAPDRLSFEARQVIRDRLPFDDDEPVNLELEIWPTRNAERRDRWRSETEARILALGGSVVERSNISEQGFVYDALLVSLPAGNVRTMLENPSAPEGLATLDGLQFVLPQTVAQSGPIEDDDVGEPEIEITDEETPHRQFDPTVPARALILDGTPIAAHEDLDGGVYIEDVHGLVRLSQVRHRRHATYMASLILRGDLNADGIPVPDSRHNATTNMEDLFRSCRSAFCPRRSH